MHDAGDERTLVRRKTGALPFDGGLDEGSLLLDGWLPFSDRHYTAVKDSLDILDDDRRKRPRIRVLPQRVELGLNPGHGSWMPERCRSRPAQPTATLP